MGRLTKTIGLTLLFLVAVLILVNIFVLMPLMRIGPVQTTPVPTEEIVTSQEHDDAIVAVDTLAVMRKIGNRVDMRYPDAEDENERNPFYWPEVKPQQKKAVKKAAKETAKQEVKQPQLSMVIISEGRKQALLDDVFVQEGDTYLGYLVKRIEGQQVFLVDDLGVLRIYLAATVDKNGKPQPVPGLVEK